MRLKATQSKALKSLSPKVHSDTCENLIYWYLCAHSVRKNVHCGVKQVGRALRGRN